MVQPLAPFPVPSVLSFHPGLPLAITSQVDLTDDIARDAPITAAVLQNAKRVLERLRCIKALDPELADIDEVINTSKNRLHTLRRIESHVRFPNPVDEVGLVMRLDNIETAQAATTVTLQNVQAATTVALQDVQAVLQNVQAVQAAMTITLQNVQAVQAATTVTLQDVQAAQAATTVVLQNVQAAQAATTVVLQNVQAAQVDMQGLLLAMHTSMQRIEAREENVQIKAHNNFLQQEDAHNHFHMLHKVEPGDGLAAATAVKPNLANVAVPNVAVAQIGAVLSQNPVNVRAWSHNDILGCVRFYNDTFGIVLGDNQQRRVDKIVNALTSVWA